MREAISFIASLAGAAVLTALAAEVPPESLFWRDLLYGGIIVLLLCAIVLCNRHDPAPAKAASQSINFGFIGFLVGSKDNLFFNVESSGFDKGFELTNNATGNRFFNAAARRTASALDDLFAEGVAERNRLIPTVTAFDPKKEDQILSRWSDRIMNRCGDTVAIKDVSRFRER